MSVCVCCDYSSSLHRAEPCNMMCESASLPWLLFTDCFHLHSPSAYTPHTRTRTSHAHTHMHTLPSPFFQECPVLRLEESGVPTVTFLSLCSSASSPLSVEGLSSHFLSAPYLCLHLAFSWEICLSLPLTPLFVLFAEDFEV